MNMTSEGIADLVSLLHHVDGHLGLAVHRSNGSEQWWKDEATHLIVRIRATIKSLEDQK